MLKVALATLILMRMGLPALADVAIQPSGVCGPNCTMYRIALSGVISDRTLEDFKGAVEDTRIIATSQQISPIVSLSSPGGSVLAAMKIGEIVRQRGYSTAVFAGQQCASACVLVLAAGVTRLADTGRIGLHRPRFDEEQFASLPLDEANKKYNEMSSAVDAYLQKMGLPEALFERMMRIASDKVEYLRPSEIDDFGLDGEDAAWSEWRRAKDIQAHGREAYEVTRRYVDVMLKCTNEAHKDFNVCQREIAPDFNRQLEQCSASGIDKASCAQAISEKMLLRYR